jgi:hypothetical protein
MLVSHPLSVDSYQYDNNGNISDGRFSYTYGSANRLTGIVSRVPHPDLYNPALFNSSCRAGRRRCS